jgi:hypothetical protein
MKLFVRTAAIPAGDAGPLSLAITCKNRLAQVDKYGLDIRCMERLAFPPVLDMKRELHQRNSCNFLQAPFTLAVSEA